MPSSPEWPEARKLYLISAWDAGHTIRDIGITLGVSKNAVVGKVHRLGLPGRPSPIRRGGPNAGVHAQQAERRAAGLATPPGRNLQPIPATVATIPKLMSLAPTRSVAVPRETPKPFARVVTCAFPIGDPGQPGFRWCADDAKRDSPYCSRHHSICYVRRDRPVADDAA
jgi:GcrA cell cycle regulator